ncbi:MAG: UDP-N-acetylmuramoyl-L-alanine--D-glutamate ligase [Bryobacteraceae bacterium]|nr:UDP-N-acetylmuramoyl-L-alanine--D-glutamate ligase [Bryobacteraceae bacterium]
MKTEGLKVVVVGMAKSGLAAAEFLSQRGALVTATDATPLEKLGDAGAMLDRLQVPFVAQNADLLEKAELVVVSPGVAAHAPDLERARSAGVPVIGEVELAARFLQGPIAAITGSNGKTTTTALLGHLLATAGVPAQVGGNIGIPPTAMVHSSRQDQWNVLELSSFQLATTYSLRARIAAILNISENHLDWHGSMNAYKEAKGRVLRHQTAEDLAVLKLDDEASLAYSGQTKARVAWFSLSTPKNGGAWLAGDDLVLDGQRLMSTKEVTLPGRHNLENILAAARMARETGAGLEAIARGVKTFAAVEHRLEFVRTRRGVKYFNDSKATTPAAALKSIEALDGPLWIILGGKDKGLDFTPLRAPLAGRTRAALLVGQDAGKIAGQLAGAVPLEQVGTIDAAVRFAAERAQAGEVVLLAPACTSWDQFKNFEERGKLFKAVVRELEGD